jgi:endonuclease G
MKIDPAILARAHLALHEAAHAYLFDRNVTLIDFGYPERGGRIAEGELALRIHVKKKLSGASLEAAAGADYTQPIPPTIGGFSTDVPQGVYRPHFWRGWGTWRPAVDGNVRAVRADPMGGGVSISDERRFAFGTLGAKAIDRITGAEMILSNWHVLAADWGARPGQRIYQPGRLDGGGYLDTVAALTRDAMSANLDAAVATLNGERRLVNDQLGLGPVSGVGEWELGMVVTKSGRSTNVTRGRIVAVEGTARIRYGYLERIIRHVMTIEPEHAGGVVSDRGDSGSLWVSDLTREAIGLHFAGSDVPERGLALDMQAVLDALDVDLATGG